MIKLNPYFLFPGTAQDAIEFYKKVFNVEPSMVQKMKDTPLQEGMERTPEMGERIMHASFPIGNDILMISDGQPDRDKESVASSQVQISIHPDSKEEADRIFSALSEGGSVTVPIAMQFWGDYYGMCKDKFGVPWMVNYHEEK
jgi:PhnB protein